MSGPVGPKFDYNEKIAANFLQNRSSAGGLHEFLGIKIVGVGPGTMQGRLEVRDELMTPIGNMHGGVLSAFSDHMLGCVCYPVMKQGQWAATTEFKINMTAPVTTGVVDAYAEIINMSRTQAVVQIRFVNEGRLAAVAQGTVTIREPRQD
ncbi:MAG TPA: PaaI family thioesterase [Pseudomonadales bacterium]|nr:PaaI family thioesterase [Pseudomonadales bacterium]